MLFRSTLQHALLRGIEAVFQLEEGEILAEPMPKRDERSGFLFYEATEGGAGVLTRLVAEPERLAEVARKALWIMHFSVTNVASLPPGVDGLADQPDTSCVAACYRCLMSYFNQPDHELLERRDQGAKRVLLRLSRSQTTVLDALRSSRRALRTADLPTTDSALVRWFDKARTLELPRPDADPLAVGDIKIPLVWREHYLAATLDDTNGPLTRQLEEIGFQVIAFGRSEAAWEGFFELLEKALGRAK